MSELEFAEDGRVLFTKEMQKNYTILTPMMLPIHFALLKSIFSQEGYHLEVLNTQNRGIIEKGLKYTHNDICYPAQLVIGQLLDALESGAYDLQKVAVLMTQTGGGCRASNYVNLLRKALKRAGLSQVPVISLNVGGMEKNPGFQLTAKIYYRLVHAIMYGDLLMLLLNQTIPYEVEAGAAEQVVSRWLNKLEEDFKVRKSLGKKALRKNAKEILQDFAKIPKVSEKKIKVGIVGEIYIKFAPLGNNNLEDFLRKEGVETVTPGLLDFVLYTADAVLEDYRLYGGGLVRYWIYKWVVGSLAGVQREVIKLIKEHGQFAAPSSFAHTKSLAKGYIGYGAKMGEGWLLTAEMLELIDQGVYNIVCTQPFGCLPNHICGRGMIRQIKSQHPESNIVAIDYDAGATKVNQENRLKLMLSTGRKQQ